MMKEYKEELHNILTGSIIEKFAVEGNFQVALSLVKIYHYSVYVWGAGKNIDAFVKFLASEGIVVRSVVDSSEEKQRKTVGDVKIISPEKFINLHENGVYVFIYTLYQCGSARERTIIDSLLKAGVKGWFCVDYTNRRLVDTVTSELFDNDRIPFYISNEHRILKSLELLYDEISRDILLDYIRTYMQCCRFKGKHIDTRYKYFFDDGGAPIYRHLDDEVWVNLGANVGDSVFCYFSNNLKCKRIYAIEGDERIFEELKDNIALLPENYKEKVTCVNSMVADDTDINEIIGTDKITLINGDIEGYELCVLNLFVDIIRRDRPVISVCLYHKKEDIVDIPLFLNDNVDKYAFFVRKYANCRGNVNLNHELVFYAVPFERLMIEEV